MGEISMLEVVYDRTSLNDFGVGGGGGGVKSSQGRDFHFHA